MITLQDYETHTFNKDQEDAINMLNDAIVTHFQVMGIDPEYTEDVWNYIDTLITEEILTNNEEQA